MKPVPCREIVVDEGEFLYRKSSQAEPDVCSVSHDLESSYVGCSEIMSVVHGFPADLLNSGTDPCPDMGMRSVFIIS